MNRTSQVLPCLCTQTLVTYAPGFANQWILIFCDVFRCSEMVHDVDSSEHAAAHRDLCPGSRPDTFLPSVSGFRSRHPGGHAMVVCASSFIMRITSPALMKESATTTPSNTPNLDRIQRLRTCCMGVAKMTNNPIVCLFALTVRNSECMCFALSMLMGRS